MRTLALLLLLTACGSDHDISMVTYNAGLATGFVPAADSRTPMVADALATLDADIVCLQEVWTVDQVKAVQDATADAYPHSYWPDTAQEVMTEPACPDGQADDIVACMEDDCGGLCPDDLVDCLFERCIIPFINLEPTCARCTMAHVGTAEPQEVLETCTTGGIEYTYGGSFGTAILSTVPLIGTETRPFDSTTSQRSMLHATAETKKGDIDLWCTHLTAGLGAIPYPRDEGSWEEEQAVQALQLADWLKDAPRPVALLGDLNNGIAGPNIDSEFEANYQALIDAGLSDPYQDLDGRCTFCPENHLNGIDSDETGRLIDHILIDGFQGEATVDRLFDETLVVDRCGNDLEGNLSDHFGVLVHIAL